MGILGMLFRPLFATVLIGVNYNSNMCIVKVVKKRSGRIVEETNKEFKILNGELSVEVMKYIKRLKSRYAYSYLCILSKTQDQVLVPGVKKNTFGNFGVSEKDYQMVKLPSAFAFMLKEDVLDYQKAFKKAKGLDFLFSPFVLLFFKAKSFIGDHPKLFALQEKETLAILVATRKEILYGAFLLMSTTSSVTNVSQTDIPSSLATSDTLIATSSTAKGIDDLNTELSGVDEELADLDSFDFNNIGVETTDENISGTSSDDEDSSTMDSLNDLGRSTGIINLLQASIKDFYQNSLYEGDFIEEIVFFDCYGMSTQAVDNVRSNLMIDLSLVTLDLSKELTNLAQIELDS
ncbi:hypothetical protein [Helicobacter didelphidarum]|uniref:hypothetical protein n=1 Tax=Helicobacter didelphidarum TaxID=2040648 RepID=UPI001FE513F6|nr:hypothetical protein [Helicobacter didelphidarum]